MSKKTQEKIRPVCLHCRSSDIRKYGIREGTQYYYCNDCRRKFRLNDCLFKMKTPHYQVAAALDEYIKGSSINQIRKHLSQHFDNYPSSKAVYGWITRYLAAAVRKYNEYRPETGETWILDETCYRFNSKIFWCIDVVDKDTCFLLASGLSASHKKQDVVAIVEQARNKARYFPVRILTDGWGGDQQIVNQAFARDRQHITTGSFGEKVDIEWIRNWLETTKLRTRILERLKKLDSISKFMEVFKSYYNFLRPQENLDGRTPAEAAKVEYTVKTWKGLIYRS